MPGRRKNKTKATQSYWLPILIILIMASAFERFWWVWIPVVVIGLLDWKYKTREVAKVTATIHEIDAMDGTEFEHFLVKLFSALGYAASHTGKSGDFGADVIIEGKDGRVAVQAKNYDTSNVGNSAVQQAIAAANYYKCDTAMVVTNSHYTKAAKEQASGSRMPVTLIDREDLMQLVAKAMVKNVA